MRRSFCTAAGSRLRLDSSLWTIWSCWSRASLRLRNGDTKFAQDSIFQKPRGLHILFTTKMSSWRRVQWKRLWGLPYPLWRYANSTLWKPAWSDGWRTKRSEQTWRYFGRQSGWSMCVDSIIWRRIGSPPRMRSGLSPTFCVANNGQSRSFDYYTNGSKMKWLRTDRYWQARCDIKLGCS